MWAMYKIISHLHCMFRYKKVDVTQIFFKSFLDNALNDLNIRNNVKEIIRTILIKPKPN